MQPVFCAGVLKYAHPTPNSAGLLYSPGKEMYNRIK